MTDQEWPPLHSDADRAFRRVRFTVMDPHNHPLLYDIDGMDITDFFVNWKFDQQWSAVARRSVVVAGMGRFDGVGAFPLPGGPSGCVKGVILTFTE